MKKSKKENIEEAARRMRRYVMIAYLFPGQGSQVKGMGADLFKEFGSLVEEANDILAYDIRDLCLNDRDNLLGQTQYTQPALFVVNALSYLKKLNATEIKPDYTAGHSLGEYNALYVAEVFDFATGVQLTQKRGKIMGKDEGGGMAAVIGLDEETFHDLSLENHLQAIDIANFNSPGQFVIAGPKNDILRAKSIFIEAGALHYAVLNVSGAFHSRYMEDARQEFAAYLEEVQLSPPKIPVISNVNAREYQDRQVKDTLLQQMTSPVQWTESIHYLMEKGDIALEQVGPGNVIKNLVKKIQRAARDSNK